MFYEIVIAPSYTPEGLEVLKGKSKNLRILEAKARPPSGLSLRQVSRCCRARRSLPLQGAPAFGTWHRCLVKASCT